jgi:hypothetical protein
VFIKGYQAAMWSNRYSGREDKSRKPGVYAVFISQNINIVSTSAKIFISRSLILI